jgi:NhaP-type Na+/H+ or K+/H+ antiporter
MATSQTASMIQLLGAGGFGALLGWYVYYINRYRKADVQLGDLVTLVGVLGGGAILAIFPQRTDLFGAYGIGLFLGFFGYLAVLIRLVIISNNFDADWFLDGRRKQPEKPVYIPQDTRPTSAAMEHRGPPAINT